MAIHIINIPYQGGAGCCCRKKSEEEKRGVRLTFLRKALLYDIRNAAYVEGHIMDGEQEHARHTLIDIGEEGNVDRVGRILDVTHALAVEMLYPYTKKPPLEETEVLDDKPQEPEEYVIDMAIPVSFSRTTIQLLEKLIHEFLVCRALYDWLMIVNPDAAPRWLEKANGAQEEINAIKNLRRDVITRPLNPW